MSEKISLDSSVIKHIVFNIMPYSFYLLLEYYNDKTNQ